MSNPRKDLTGQEFGYLTVVSFAGRKRGKAQWQCTCICGATATVYGFSLSSSHTSSCGCKRRLAPAGVIKHGLTGTRAHRIWGKMIGRCINPKTKNFHRYGGRGIQVCDRWQTFINFFADMGAPPAGHSLDRYPNRNGDYEPGNCRWATDDQQSRNRDYAHEITKDGVTLSITEWSEKLCLSRNTIERRIDQGWPKERWLDPPRIVRSERPYLHAITENMEATAP